MADFQYGIVTNSALGETLTTLATYDVRDKDRLAVEIAVTDNALDQFVIQIQMHESGSGLTAYSAAADYTSVTGILVGASGDLTAITAGASGWFIIDTRGVRNVIVRAASSSASNSGVTLYATSS